MVKMYFYCLTLAAAIRASCTMRLEYDKPAVGEFTIRTLVFFALRDNAVPNFRFVFFTATVVSLDGERAIK